MGEKIIEDIIDIKAHAEKVYNSFVYPLHKLGKTERAEFLKNLKDELENLSRTLGSLLGYSAIQFSKEIDSEKIKLFQNDFSAFCGKIQQQIFLELHTKEVDNYLVNIKNEISLPEAYFNLEQAIKNEINNLNLYLDSVRKQIEYKYVDMINKKRSVEELLALLDKKENQIIELNKKIDELRYIEAKEKSKSSRISSLEEDLLKSYKASEQDLTIFKLHVLQIEKTLENLTRDTKQLVYDINQLEAKTMLKEQNSLDLIKELKKELLANRYMLTKK